MNYAFTIVLVIVLFLGAVFLVSNRDSAPSEKHMNDESTQSSSTSTTNTDTSGPTLDLSGRGLVKVPDSVFSRTNIEVLDLSHNNLDGALQAEVRQLQNLRVLDLSDNNFTGVPAEVGQLSKLETLDLSNNPITGLPYEIGNLKNLKLLDLRGTNYSTHDLEVIRQTLSADVVVKVD